MVTPPPNPDTRALPDGLLIQQHRNEQRINVNMGEQPPRSSRGHLFGSIPQDFAHDSDDHSPDHSPSAPQPDRPIMGYGNDDAAVFPAPGEQLPPLGTYNPLQSRHVASPPSGSQNIGNDPNKRVVYVEEERKHQRAGLGGGAGVALGAGAGLLGSALLGNAIDGTYEDDFGDGGDDFGGGDFF
ncbi:hypothetical protein OG21DRAFT_1509876 [Imleria badia]|nr:hypothetical protein OG21DRAFT_1509876 [Imleria badia]